ncbi:MAG: helix-turn-helix domain-containing protein [Aristaeellaceae bacterium]
MESEFKAQGAALYHKMTSYQSQEYLMHVHTAYEFYYFLKGDVVYSYRGQQVRLSPHSLLFIHPGVEHGCKTLSTAPYDRYTFHFEPMSFREQKLQQLLGMVDERLGQDMPLYMLPPDNGIRPLMDNFLRCTWLTQQQKAEQLPVLTESLLFHLLLHKPVRAGTLSLEARNHPDKLKGRIAEVVYWINGNLSEPISVEQVARLFFVSRNTLNRDFQTAMGMSVRDYIRSQRVVLARHLMGEGYPATLAATNAGFKDYSTFYRAYKALMGCAPHEKN